MIRLYGISLALLAAMPIPAIAADSITDILHNPSAYDSKHVEISGTITGLEEKISAKGNDYDVFSLCSGNGCLHVFTFGRPELVEGDKLTVHGTFTAVKHVGSYAYHNEVEADEGSLK